MSQEQIGASSAVRVTVTSGSRAVDLVLPGAVPVAELLPELARSVGLLQAATVHGGYHLVTSAGHVLAGDAGLVHQGVGDGGLVTVTAGIDDPTPRVYDDVAEAMADVVQAHLNPWQPSFGRRAARGAAALLLALGAIALMLPNARLAVVAASVLSACLVTGAVLLSRVRHESEAAVALAWLASVYAIVAGLLLSDGNLVDRPLDHAGAGAVVAGLLCLVGIDTGRPLVIPPVVLGLVLLGTGLVLRAGSLEPGGLLTATLALLVAAGSVFPRLALATAGTRVDQLTDDAVACPDGIDASSLAADAKTAHDILVGIMATVGLLLVTIGPVAVSLGFVGTVLGVVCCVVVLLRTRQYWAAAEVLVGLVSGTLGLGAIAVAVLCLHPDWRPATAVILVATGGALLVVTLRPPVAGIRLRRLGELAESVALISLLPLVAVATGVLESLSA